MNQEYQYLVGRIQEALATDARVNALDIRVNVVHGRVHLTGEVPTEERRAAVLSIAGELAPDLEIRNEITVLELAGGGKEEAVD